MLRCAFPSDLPALALLACQLWPENTLSEMEAEFRRILACPDNAVFLAFASGCSIGFAHVSLRRDYVEGTETSPVGYLEGVYVLPPYRRMGYARGLVAECEAWARSVGCQEFASDCESDNTGSLRFHLQMGFSEANRIICFAKRL